MKRASLLLAIIITIIFIMLAISGARAKESLDQQQTTTNGSYAAIIANNDAAQTFTSGQNGYLTRISLMLRMRTGMDSTTMETLYPGNLIVELRSTSWGTALLDGGNSGTIDTFVPTEEVLAHTLLLTDSTTPDATQW